MKKDVFEPFNSLFLGPHGENADILLELLENVVNAHASRRESFHREDPTFILPVDKTNPNYQNSLAALRAATAEVLRRLGEDIPWWSPRYMAHMNTDVLLPAVVGYFATMLDNPNNVVEESSPPSSKMEAEAIDELLEMVGFIPKGNGSAGGQTGWGYFTSGGTVANLEALWVARNVKFLPLAARNFAKKVLKIDIQITLPNGEQRSLVDVRREDEWELLNLTYEVALGIRQELINHIAPEGSTKEARDNAKEQVDDGLRSYSLSSKGLWLNWITEKPVVIVSGTAHYSLKKAVEVLGIGRDQLISIEPDSSFRMNVKKLGEELRECRKESRPVIAVVATVGTTEEAAIDPVHEILGLREELKKAGLWFPVHVDAAYGGYVRTLFLGPKVDGKDTSVSRDQVRKNIGYNWPPDAVFDAQNAIPHAESVTIDPHKKGYVPYPCGAILFADKRVRDVISSDAPYLWHDKIEEYSGPYTLEGTRPGAASVAAWLSQKVLPLNTEGHGLLIAGSVKNAQALYYALNKMDPIIVGQRRIKIFTVGQPDFSIVCFALNFEGNDKLDVMNSLTKETCERFAPHKKKEYTPDKSKQPKSNPHYGKADYFISNTTFNYKEYRESLLPFLKQAGIRSKDYKDKKAGVEIIRMAVMHPWSLVRADGIDFIQGFCGALQEFLIGYYQS